MKTCARADGRSGYTVLELVLVGAMATIVAGIAVPLTNGEIDDARTAAAARHLASRLVLARAQAARRAVRVALRFQRIGDDYAYATYVDGNGNGVLARDIQSGIDTPIAAPERVGQHFPGVRFGVLPGVTGVDGAEALSELSDAIRVGSADMVSFSPDGSGSSGTLYVRGRRRQGAVRVLGTSGRVRTLAFDFLAREWRQQ
jgi:Tfp pilus assembly protein FimT